MNTDFPYTVPAGYYGLRIGNASSSVGHAEIYGAKIKIVESPSVPPGTVYMTTDPGGESDIVITRSVPLPPPPPPPKRNLLID